MSEPSKMELDRHFAWFEERLPPEPARFVRWLRKPSSRYVRIPLAIVLIVGGIFSFLPVLALWMLPLGLLLFAQDVPILQNALGAVARLHRAQVDRTSRRKKRAVTPSKRLLDSIFASVATHDVTQKPTPAINQGFHHN